MKGTPKRLHNSASVAPDKCVFCRIVRGELPAEKVYEDDRYIAFLDINPFSRGHTLVSPKAHGETIWDMDEHDIGELFMTASEVSKAVVEVTGADGFRFVQNNGEAANQVVAHVHVHVIPIAMHEKGKVMDRLKLTPEQLAETAKKIRESLARN
ncbi:MAG: HIT domain-containing protein [Nitrososphaerota archaeon]|nr:HIT domain-containing protein [Nitrososphaerota archaeon]